MKKILVLLLIIPICASVKSQPELEKTLLWQISGKEIKKPSYVYGTLHIMCPNDMMVSNVIKEKFATTEQLFLEVKTDDPGMMMEMMKGITMKDSSTLKSLLGTKDFDSTNAIFKKSTGMPLEMLNTAKPILIISMIYPTLLGCTPDSWEKTFEKLAKEKNIPLKGLEKLSDQIAVLENIPYHEQAEMMRKLLYNLDSAKVVFMNMLDIYKKKDVTALYNMTTSDEDFGQYEGEMLIERNKKWIPVITKEAALMPTFFACGAAHLGGEKGVINLLRNAGYTVSPVLY